jgi:hypothetical protein
MYIHVCVFPVKSFLNNPHGWPVFRSYLEAMITPPCPGTKGISVQIKSREGKRTVTVLCRILKCADVLSTLLGASAVDVCEELPGDMQIARCWGYDQRRREVGIVLEDVGR